MIDVKKILQDPTMRKVLILLALIAVVFWPTLKGMYTTWMEDSNNSHGIVVPIIVIYLIHRKLRSRLVGPLPFCKQNEDVRTSRDDMKCGRDDTQSSNKKEPSTHVVPAEAGTLDPGSSAGTTSGRDSVIGFIGLVCSLLFYVFSVLMDIAVFKNISFVLCVQSTVLFVFGWALTQQLLFPLFFLFFMVPVPVTLYGMIALPMQLFATKLSVGILQFTPLPISANGNVIRVGNAMLEVAEACSGLRSLMSFIMLSLLFAYLARTSFVKRSIMVVSSIPLAICGNIIRLIFTAFVAYVYGSQIASGFIHDVSGYVMFVAAFLVFMWLAKVLEN
ncbi:exosortase/archaeosortase family protein [Candidatus Omnitrophota bacterium]